ncbi:MAG: FecR family protein [Mucilaginibacter sp.]
MQQQNAKELLRKYREGLATEAEQNLLEDWALFGKLKELDLTDEEIETELSLIGKDLPLYKERRLNLWPRIAAAAAVLIFIGAAVLFFNRANKQTKTAIGTRNELVFVSPIGKKTSFSLADGSKIILNGGSKLIVSKGFNINNREVLLDGEGYFRVVHNSKQPFTVHTKRIDVRDIGTEFNVAAYQEDKNTEIALIKGAVEVTVNDKVQSKVLMAPNQKFVIANNANINNKDNKILIEKPFIIRPLAISAVSNSLAETDWAQNKLTFDDLAFEDIALQMERWYGVKFVFENQAVRIYHFTASFDREDITQVLEALKLSGNFNYRKEGNVISIY